MFKLSDRVKESSITTGSGNIVLSGPYGSFQSFEDGIGDLNTTYYAIENGLQWEIGQGTYYVRDNELSRDIVFDSSAGGSLISLTGVSVVFCTLPADKALVIDDDGRGRLDVIDATSGIFQELFSKNLDLSNNFTASGDGYFGGDLQVVSDANFGGDLVVSGDLTTGGDILSSGFLTLVRENSAGNFFHAYKDDGVNRTVSLHVDSNANNPLWKLGVKADPSSQNTPPQLAYVYGRYSTTNPIIGVLADNNNYLQLDPSFGFTVTHSGTSIISAKDAGIEITPKFNGYGISVTPKPLSPENMQEWRNSSDSASTIVDSGGRIGIMTGDSQLGYDLVVNGSGEMPVLQLTSGVYFPDGSFQFRAASGDIVALSGWVTDYIDGNHTNEVSGWADATMLNRDAALSGYLETYIIEVADSGYQNNVALSGYLEEYILEVADSGHQNTIAVSGWADQTITNTGVAVSGWTRNITFFTEDLTVSLPNGKTFGRYETGETIPASGKTPREVIEMAIVEPIAPTVSLTSSSSVDFNQTAVSNTLNFSHTINSFGATVATASLEFRRANTGSWTVISSSTSTPSSFVHSFTDTAYNTDVINYRYVVTDTAGGTATATKDIQPDTYSNPTISLSVAGATISSPESWNSREKGNVSSTLTCTINRNETYVDLQTYEIEYSLNGGAYQVINSGNIGPGNTTITPFAHNPVADNAANNMRYRVKVVDQYLDSIGSQRYSSVRQVNYNYILYFGSESAAATTSNDVRGLSNKRFPSAGDTFDFNTGNTLRFFNVAIPDGETISSVIDLDALNANITSSYINNPFNVQDFGGNNKLYNVYTMEVAVPYSSSHTHRITKG